MPYPGIPDSEIPKMEKCVTRVMGQGHDKSSAIAICHKAIMGGKMDDFKRFVPISKVDQEEKMVYGWASTPDLDTQGEIVSIDAIKNALPEYLKYPTIREMHQPNAVGVTKQTTIDEQKGLYIGAKIVDSNAWEKVKEGVFRGFSIGGTIVNKVGDTIKELDLIEISLVDSPANKNAAIELWKSSGPTKELAVLARLSKAQIKQFAKEVIIKMSDKMKKDDEVVAEETTEVSAETPEVFEEATAETPAVEETTEAAELAAEGGEAAETVEASAKTEDIVKAIRAEIAKGFASISEAKTEKVEKVEFAKVEALAALEKRIKALEDLPAVSKVKSPAVVVEKSFGEESASTGRLDEVNKRLDELAKMRKENLEKYQTQGFKDEAIRLLDEKTVLEN